MDLYLSPELNQILKKIKIRNPELIKKIEKQLKIFQQNHLYPSLRTHKLSGTMNNIWSISIDRQIRMLYFLDEKGAYFFDIGTHNQVYKK